jgi:predicted transcriptional regulator
MSETTENAAISMGELRQMVTDLIESTTNGNQMEFCRLYDLHQPDVSSFLSGKRGPGRKLLDAIGMREERRFFFLADSD